MATYAFSDLHGDYQLWTAIKNYCKDDDILFFLGDVNDRGNDGIKILQEMIDEVGKDQQGQIGFEEFKQIMTKTIRDEFTQNSSIEAFAVFDKNKSGKIKKENLQNILLTKGDQNMTDNEVQDLLDHYIDFDENGEINYKDFVKQTFDLFK